MRKCELHLKNYCSFPARDYVNRTDLAVINPENYDHNIPTFCLGVKILIEL